MCPEHLPFVKYKPVYEAGWFADVCPMLGLVCYDVKTLRMMKISSPVPKKGKFIPWTSFRLKKMASSGGLNLGLCGRGACEM